jgi:hypothetical protein
MSLDKYVSLDVSRHSEAAKDLLARVELESPHEKIVLTPVYSLEGHPPFLTQEMDAWYRSWIQPFRGPALEEVISAFQSRTLPRGGNAVLFEHARDRIEQKKHQEIGVERETFKQKKEVEGVLRELRESREQYGSLKREYGREATRWTPRRYWIILFLFMCPEFLINWDSFLKIPWFTPAYATGLILVVAIGFAFSAHSVGKILKQWKELFGGHVAHTEKMRSVRELTIALILLCLGMAAVAVGRWFFILPSIQEKEMLQGGGLDTTDIIQFGGVMLGNFIVYLLGVLWSFYKHDAVPGFSELREQVERLEKRELNLFERDLTKRNQRHIQQAQKLLEQLNRVEAAQKQQLQGYDVARELFGKLKHKDEQVVALLLEYRNRLIGKAKSMKPARWFSYDDIAKIDVDMEMKLSPDQYAAIPVGLRYL